GFTPQWLILFLWSRAMPDNRRLILCAALWLIGTVSTSSAQNTPLVNRSPEVPPPTVTNDSTPGAIGPKKPGTKEAHPRYPSSALSYGSTPSNYPSGASKLRTEKLDPNAVTA